MGQEDVIARRYARGLADYAAEAGDMERVREDLDVLSAMLDSRSGAAHVPEFADFLASPAAATEEKLVATAAIMEKADIGKTVADFLAVLVRKNRSGLVPRIHRAFADIAGGMTGEYTAVVHTARALSPDQSRRLRDALSSAFGCTVRLHQQVEPGLLAGARVTVGDKTFDGTVLGRFEQLRHRLISRGAEDIAEMETESRTNA